MVLAGSEPGNNQGASGAASRLNFRIVYSFFAPQEYINAALSDKV